MNVRTSARSRLAAAIAGIGSITLVLGGVALFSAPSASAEPMTGGKNDCKSAGIPGAQLKVDPKDGVYKGAKGFEVKVTVRTLTQDDPSVAGDQTGNQVFDFEASRVAYGVVVKGGPGTNKYNYMPSGKSSDTGLHAKVNSNDQKFYDLSHISFCYNPCPPSTPPTPTKPTIPTVPTKPTVPTVPTKPPTSQPSQPTQPTSQPTQPSQPTVPTEEPTPTNPAPTGTPTEPGEDETPTPGIPTEVEAGAGGDGSSGISLLGNDDNGGGGGALAAGLLTLGGLLLAVGALVFGLRRGQHSL